jgi:hypothetical protein
VLFAFLLPLPARAANAEASQQFENGKQAFAAQDYAAALDAFEAAAAAGMTGPVVHFNIGVCAYRVGEWSRAAAAFRDTAQTPSMAALAHYNLGLVALAESKQDEATRWFMLAQREGGDERLRSLATEQLARLPQPVERNWLVYGAFGGGYDDNVALVAGGDVLGVSDTADTFAEAQLAFSAPLTGPWRLDAGLVWLDYQDLDSFDQMTVSAGGRYRVPLGDWRAEAGLQLEYSTLDSEGFENKQMLILQGTRPLSEEWQLRLRYRFSNVDGLDGFGGLDGTRHDLRIRGTWQRGSWEIAVGYRFDSTDYQEDSLSYDRQQATADATYDLAANWTFTAGLSVDRTSYDATENGSEDRTEIVVAASRAFGTQWRAVVRYAYANNEADLPEFDYGRNRISAGVEATW